MDCRILVIYPEPETRQAQVIHFYQLLARGRWFSPSTPASSTTKTGCHDIVEILLKVALNTKKLNQMKTISSTDVEDDEPIP
jgi:hypothetical protein